jgi:hypothetical protein
MEQDSISEVKLLAESARDELLEKVYLLMADGVLVLGNWMILRK